MAKNKKNQANSDKARKVLPLLLKVDFSRGE